MMFEYLKLWICWSHPHTWNQIYSP